MTKSLLQKRLEQVKNEMDKCCEKDKNNDYMQGIVDGLDAAIRETELFFEEVMETAGDANV